MYDYKYSEEYWPYSIYSGGHYFMGPMTFNNRDRYFDYRPFLGLYRNLDLGTWEPQEIKE